MDPLSPLGYHISSEKAVSITAFSRISLLLKYSKEKKNIPKKAITSTKGRNVTIWKQLSVVNILHIGKYKQLVRNEPSDNIFWSFPHPNEKTIFSFLIFKISTLNENVKGAISERRPGLHASFSPLLSLNKINGTAYYSHCQQEYKLLTFLRDNAHKAPKP